MYPKNEIKSWGSRTFFRDIQQYLRVPPQKGENTITQQKHIKLNHNAFQKKEKQ